MSVNEEMAATPSYRYVRRLTDTERPKALQPVANLRLLTWVAPAARFSAPAPLSVAVLLDSRIASAVIETPPLRTARPRRASSGYQGAAGSRTLLPIRDLSCNLDTLPVRELASALHEAAGQVAPRCMLPTHALDFPPRYMPAHADASTPTAAAECRGAVQDEDATSYSGRLCSSPVFPLGVEKLPLFTPGGGLTESISSGLDIDAEADGDSAWDGACCAPASRSTEPLAAPMYRRRACELGYFNSGIGFHAAPSRSDPGIASFTPSLPIWGAADDNRLPSCAGGEPWPGSMPFAAAALADQSPEPLPEGVYVGQSPYCSCQVSYPSMPQQLLSGLVVEEHTAAVEAVMQPPPPPAALPKAPAEAVELASAPISVDFWSKASIAAGHFGFSSAPLPLPLLHSVSTGIEGPEARGAAACAVRRSGGTWSRLRGRARGLGRRLVGCFVAGPEE